MLKLPMWVRVVLGGSAVLLFEILSLYLEYFAGWAEYGQLALLPGAGIFVYLNPELIRGD